MGLKAVSRGESHETYDDLLYVKQRFIHKEGLQQAIAAVTNATFALRQEHIWGRGPSPAPRIRAASVPGART